MTDRRVGVVEYVAKFAAGDKSKDDDEDDEDDEVSLQFISAVRSLRVAQELMTPLYRRTRTKQIITAEEKKQTTWTFDPPPRPSPLPFAALRTRLVAFTITVSSPP